MARPDPAGSKAVDEYLAKVPPAYRRVLANLRKAIQAAAPGATETISYKMPAFRQNGVLVWYAAFRDHCSFFVGSHTVRRSFSEELKPFDRGKGTLHFTPARPLPLGLVRRIVRARVAENRARSAK
jgi:uncharacterized protein YdhG (YjbR/CyaY superfamily)